MAADIVISKPAQRQVEVGQQSGGSFPNDYAKEATLTDGITDIRADIANIDIDTTTLAKQGTNPNATLSEVQTQATSAASDAAAAKTAAQGITGYALQGSDAMATNTAIAGLIGYTISEIDGV